MNRFLFVLGVIVVLLGVSHAQDDAGWLSLTPGGPPLEQLEADVGDTVTLWLVLFNDSLPAAAITFPIQYDFHVEVLDFDFDSAAFDFGVDCQSSYNFFLNNDPVERVVAFYTWTASYPVCEVPVDSWQSVGWIQLQYLEAGLAHLVEGTSPWGGNLPLIYSDGTTGLDVYPEFVELELMIHDNRAWLSSDSSGDPVLDSLEILWESETELHVMMENKDPLVGITYCVSYDPAKVELLDAVIDSSDFPNWPMWAIQSFVEDTILDDTGRVRFYFDNLGDPGTALPEAIHSLGTINFRPLDMGTFRIDTCFYPPDAQGIRYVDTLLQVRSVQWQPVEVTILGPEMIVTPDSLHLVALWGSTILDSFCIANHGQTDLRVDSLVALSDWFWTDLNGFIVNPEGSVIVQLTATSEPLDPGLHMDSLLIHSNDVVNPYPVNIVLEVMNPPKIAVTPETLSHVLEIGTIDTFPFCIINTGGDSLVFDIETECFDSVEVRDPQRTDWLSTTVVSGSLAESDSISVGAIFDATALQSGNYSGVIRILSNDSTQDTVLIWSYLCVINIDFAWLSLSPAGPPLEWLPATQGEIHTLWAVLENQNASASSINFPVQYPPMIGILDFGMDSSSFDFMGYCGQTYTFLPYHDPSERMLTWYCYTGSYPVCDVPLGSQQSVGWFTFQVLYYDIDTITTGYGPTGLPLLYTNGETAIDYYPNFIPILVGGGYEVKESASFGIPLVNFLAEPEPNPFLGSTSIRFGLKEAQRVTLSIYDATGRAVRSLVDGKKDAGNHNLAWDGRDNSGRRCPSGVYFVKLTTESFSSARKVVLR